ncbi:MAG: DUF1848 family protein [Candidatus Aminicenantales bacterium]
MAIGKERGLLPEKQAREPSSPGLKKVVSASRRSDLVAHFPGWLAEALAKEKVAVSRRIRRPQVVDLRPSSVHTLVLWSKDFSHLLSNKFSLLDLCQKYDQIFFHLTVTGLGGTLVERHVPAPETTLAQVKPLIAIAKDKARLSLRFDPVVFWFEGKRLKSNLEFFPLLAKQASSYGLRQVRFSFAQWYPKAIRRAAQAGFPYFDPPESEKLEAAAWLSKVAEAYDIELLACAQSFLTVVSGIKPSACINGAWLEKLHPRQEPVSKRKDKTQRQECNCTESIDIGSYAQSCPHSCLYCYANSRL